MEKKSKTTSKCQVSGKKDLKKNHIIRFLPPVNKLRKIGI